MLRSKLWVIAGVLVLAVVLAACGGDGDGSQAGASGLRTIEITALDELV